MVVVVCSVLSLVLMTIGAHKSRKYRREMLMRDALLLAAFDRTEAEHACRELSRMARASEGYSSARLFEFRPSPDARMWTSSASQPPFSFNHAEEDGRRAEDFFFERYV